MEQTFNDLLRARIEDDKELFSFVLWMFVETFAAALGENMTSIISKNRALVRILLVTALVLMLPLIAMQFTDEVKWGLEDFTVAGALLIGTGITFELIASKMRNLAYRAAAGVAMATALLLVWVNLAVGIVGNEENPANLMYIGVLAIGIVGAIIARFQPHGMARALLLMAIAQVMVAVIVVIADLGSTGPIWPRDVLGATGLFAALWLGSALLFRRAAQKQSDAGTALENN